MLLIGCLSIEEWLDVKLKVVLRLSFVSAVARGGAGGGPCPPPIFFHRK